MERCQGGITFRIVDGTNTAGSLVFVFGQSLHEEIPEQAEPFVLYLEWIAVLLIKYS